MGKGKLYLQLTHNAWKAVCQQLWLLAALSMLFLLLGRGVGPVAESLLSQGAAFEGMTIAVAAPEGDATGELLGQLTGNMEDISAYCTFRSMDREAAEAALEAGEVTAVLVLPENFLAGVLNGANPEVTLLVSGDRPLESLLTLWVGQSAADLLSAAQRGIYAVLDSWEPETGLSYQQVMTDINMRFISRTLDRQAMFKLSRLRAVDAMELKDHYGLSILVFLMLTLAPMLRPALRGNDLALRRRLRSLGYTGARQYAGCLAAGFGLLLPVALIPGGVLTRWNLPALGLLTVFTVCFGSFCCLAADTGAGCGTLAFVLGAAGLFVSGGVLPPALLPSLLRRVGEWTPVALLRSCLYLPLPRWGWKGVLALAWSALFALAAGICYARLLAKEAEE